MQKAIKVNLLICFILAFILGCDGRYDLMSPDQLRSLTGMNISNDPPGATDPSAPQFDPIEGQRITISQPTINTLRINWKAAQGTDLQYKIYHSLSPILKFIYLDTLDTDPNVRIAMNWTLLTDTTVDITINPTIYHPLSNPTGNLNTTNYINVAVKNPGDKINLYKMIDFMPVPK